MDNEYKITKCVTTYDIQKKYMKGIIENIKIEKHRIIIKTNKMIYIIKNKVNFFSCENNSEKYIGCKILSWKYYDKNFIFKMKGENMIVNINGTNENKIFYGKRILPKVFGIIEKINVTNHRIIIKTNLIVIKIKNMESIFYDDNRINTIIGDTLVGWDIVSGYINIKVENLSKNVVTFSYDYNDYDNKVTLYKVDTYMEKSKYGKVKKVKINESDITIKTTRGYFTFTRYYDDDGLYSRGCPYLYENINDIIGKEIITIESEYHNKIIHCNGDTYLIATRNYDDDEYVYPHVRYGIECHAYFF